MQHRFEEHKHSLKKARTDLLHVTEMQSKWQTLLACIEVGHLSNVSAAYHVLVDSLIDASDDRHSFRFTRHLAVRTWHLCAEMLRPLLFRDEGIDVAATASIVTQVTQHMEQHIIWATEELEDVEARDLSERIMAGQYLIVPSGGSASDSLPPLQGPPFPLPEGPPPG